MVDDQVLERREGETGRWVCGSGDVWEGSDAYGGKVNSGQVFIVFHIRVSWRIDLEDAASL